MSSLDENPFKNKVTAELFKGVVHRFSNMMSAEVVRQFKQQQLLKKSIALRQSLQGKSYKKSKKVEGVPTITDVISEPLPKPASHFALKALAFKGDHIFETLPALQIKFLMMGYGLQATRGNTKKILSEKLVAALKINNDMPEPTKLTQGQPPMSLKFQLIILIHL